MPLTPAEKQKNYREKLKANNPEKYEEIKKKAAENALRYYRNKRVNYKGDQKEEQRRKWKEDRKKPKNNCQQPCSKTTDKESVDLRNIQRRIEYKFQQENMRLLKDLFNLSKRFNNLQNLLYRHQKQIDETNENLKNVLIRLKQLENSKTSTESEEASMMRQNTAEYTPRKRVEELISENIPHIETPKKEVIKQKLLEHDVLTEALKLEMKSSNQAEKRTFKKVLKNDLVEKYRQKTKLTLSLGFKGSLKKYTRLKFVRLLCYKIK
ncbi:unnamed protein product [Parnassius apollo]|uniref:(apollo) hypothetical protein n=1 Tax=Parnassius apollo TaxID=110799 RepID=A0A8S3XWR5_PARAO|nr:unnamed protein product [Parnassius apollo]